MGVNNMFKGVSKLFKTDLNPSLRRVFFLPLSLSFLSVVSCTVDTPTVEYNKQTKLLSSSGASYLLLKDYYGLILASKDNLTLKVYEDSLLNRSSKQFKDFLRAFRIWEQFNLTKDPLFFIKAKDSWNKLGFTYQLNKEKLNFKPLPGLEISLDDLINLLRFDKITQIGNSVKELLVVERYLKSSELDTSSLNFSAELKSLIKEGEFGSNLIAYLLEHNPIIRFDFSSQDPLLISAARYLKISSIDDFNSLFNILAPSQLEQNVSSDLIKLLFANYLAKDRFIFGYKGLEFKESAVSGDLGLDSLTLSRQGPLLTGFSNDNGGRIISLKELKFANYLKGKKLLDVELKPGLKIDRSNPPLDVDSYVFLDQETNQLTKTNDNLHYRIKGVLKTGEAEVSILVEVSHTRYKELTRTYLLKLDLNQTRPRSYAISARLRQNEFISPKVSDNKLVSLELLVRLTPDLNFDSKTGKPILSLNKTPFASTPLFTWISLLLLNKDDSLARRARIYYAHQGFMVKSEEPVSKGLVDSLGLS